MAQSRSILVSGGGIAGLTAALALSKRGYRLEVCERSTELASIGAGIQLSPNALRVLDDLGVGSAIRRVASAPDGILMRSSRNNRVVKTIPLGSHAIARYGLPYLCLHRAELQQTLVAACKNNPDISVNLNSQVCDATVHSNGVSALVMKGDKMQTRRGRALIVADGVHSKLRDRVSNAGLVNHSGFEAWRAMIPAERVPGWVDLDFTHVIMGGGAHAVLYPVSSKRYLNVVICTKAQETAVQACPAAKSETLLKRLSHWGRNYHDLFRAADSWSIWPILERSKTCFWNGGPVAFLGDASHAMPPFAAQGAAMAIEDAALLAECIQTHGVTPKAMEELSIFRTSRIEKMRKLARSNGRIYHLAWPLSFARNLGMKFIPAKSLLDRQSWVYDWRVQDARLDA